MAGLSFDLIALQLFTGLALGAIYVLFAIGLSLIFGMLTVVNFAHGAFYMVGAYVGLFLLSLGGNFWLCLIAVPLIVGTVGLVVERFLIRLSVRYAGNPAGRGQYRRRIFPSLSPVRHRYCGCGPSGPLALP
jgi:branched-subunit amino acid ABC-type transport system permease component